jgi:hypothetical protein
MMQFHCALCSEPNTSRFDGRLMQRPGTLAMNGTAWLIHQTCTHAWVEVFGSYWVYVDLKPRVVESVMGGQR